MSLSEVQKFYKGKSVFITGGSGFMGKILVEKLLYSCSELEAVYILMRPKRGKAPEARLEAMFKLPIFQRIRDEKPDVLKKLIPVQGDITFDNLGISGPIYDEVIAKTNIVFHCAATLRLEAKLKDAVQMNLAGTKRIIQLVKEMKNLDLFLHLSTAFCYCDLEVLEEKVLDSPHDPDDIMRLAEWMEDKTLDAITPDLLKPHPNTYTYTKRLAETLVRREYPNIPCGIIRPSIVTPACFEPVEGWVDSLNGPIGLLVGGGKGVIRTMLCNAEYPAEVIPVDMAINGVITAAFKICTTAEKPKSIPVFNMTCDEDTTLTYGTIMEEGKRFVYETPFEAGVWYPNGTLTTSKILHKIQLALFHWLPAYFIDFICLCLGQPRFMCRVQQKVSDGLFILQFFTMNIWNFKNENFLSLHKELSPADQKNFNMDPRSVDILPYIKRTILGARQYCMKEPLSSIPKARLQLKALYVLDRVTKLFFLGLFLWGFLKVTGLYSIIGDLLK